jgi:hypothetical protein
MSIASGFLSRRAFRSIAACGIELKGPRILTLRRDLINCSLTNFWGLRQRTSGKIQEGGHVQALAIDRNVMAAM